MCLTVCPLIPGKIILVFLSGCLSATHFFFTQSSVNVPGGYAAGLPDADTALMQAARRQTESIQRGGAHWPILTTEFFRIHYQPGGIPDSIACREMDVFVDQILTKLDPSGARVGELREQKMSYYLCDDDTVEKLTGYSTKGMADLSGRAVISSHFPHFHELAHLLVHITRQEPPLQTHPLLQEGIACLLGGRWGRAPATILYTSWVHRSFGMGKLDEIMTRDDFFTFQGGPDVAYPLGAMLCEVVRHEAGWPGLMALYENLSGSAEFVTSLTAEEVMGSVAAVCGWPLHEGRHRLDEAMDLAWPDYRQCGIAPGIPLPVEELVQVITLDGGEVRVRRRGERFMVQVKAEFFPVYLLSPATGREASSSLFADHLPDETYQGQRYGLRCSPNNIAWYDFATNQLLATWVSDFTDEHEACDDQNNGLVFEIFGPAPANLEWLMSEGCRLQH